MNKEPVKIVEFDLPVNIDDSRIQPYQSGVFAHTYRVDPEWFETSYFADWGFTNDINTSPINVGSFTSADFNDHIKVNSIADCETQEGSFYATDYVIYVHYPETEAYWATTSRYGKVNGFTNREWEHSDGSINNLAGNLAYLTRVIDTDDIERRLDVKSNGLFLYNKASAEMQNADGYFNQYLSRVLNSNGNVTNQLFGRPFRVLRGYDGQDYDSFTQVFAGTIDTYSSPTENRFAIYGLDNREKLSRELPIETLNDTDYPNIDPELINTSKPLAGGINRYAKAVPLNTGVETLPDEIQFMYNTGESTTLYAVYAVYDDGTGFNTISSANYSNDLTSSIITIDKSAILEPGETNKIGDIYIYFHVDNLGIYDCIVDTLEKHAGISYTSSTFDTTTWPTGGASGGFYATDDNRLKISEALEFLLAGSIDYVTTDGLGRYQYISLKTTATHTIDEAAITSGISIIEKSDEYVSKIELGYNNKFDRLINNDLEDELRLSYFRRKSQKIETPLTSVPKVQDLADDILELRGAIVPTASFRYEKFEELELGEAVTWEIEAAKYTDETGTTTYKKWNVIAIAEMTRNIELRLRP